MKKVSLVLLAVLIGLSMFLTQPVGGATNQAQTKIHYDLSTRFERILVEDGLPNATVLSVLQDQEGFMWFATADGLARYDGSNFTVFRHSEEGNSLSNNNTFCLVQSSDGLIWIGTDPGGLNVYDPQTGLFDVYRHDPGNEYSLAQDSIWSLIEDRDGNIWAGTRDGLSRLDRATGNFYNYHFDAENPRALAGAVVYRVYQDKTGTIWVGTRAGLQRYEPETDDFTLFANDPEDPTTLSHNNVWSMLEDSQGNFWVGTRNGGLNLMDRENETFKAYRFNPDNPDSLSSDRVWFVFEDSSANLWVLTEDAGLNLLNPQSGTAIRYLYSASDPFSLSNDDLFWMTEDRSGALWITSRYGGVNRLAPMLQRFGLYRNIPGDPNSISSNSVYSMFPEGDDILWVGTFGSGLNRVNRKTGQVQVFQPDPDEPGSISNDKIYYIHRDKQGVLWAATSGGGLNRMDPQTGKFTAYRYSADKPNVIGSSFLTTIDDADEGRLWVGTLGFGLNLFNPQTGEMDKEYEHDPENPNSLSEGTVYDLEVDSQGRVWIATARGGLELLDPRTDTFTHHREDDENPNSILSDTVHALYLDEEKGMIWAGTSAGLSGLNFNTGEWTNYTVRDGLPNSTIMGIQPGNTGELWISTGKGISRLAIETGLFTNYDARDGLQGDQFQIASSRRGPDGEIFFGGSAGLTFFHPAEIMQNLYAPQAVLTGFYLFNEPVMVGGEILPQPIEQTREISLAYDQSVFTFQFAALSYQISSKNQFQYKMEGFDRDWSPARTTNEATYTNLAPGTYTFMVRAANHDGYWSDTPASIQIEIRPPWWGTWWFRAGSILALILLIAGGVNLRIRNIRATNRELEERVDERTRELQDAQQKLQKANADLKNQLAEIIALEQKVREQAVRDALTGLYNRHYLSEVLDAELSRAKRGSYTVAFLLVDLDHFKDVNDRYGHPAGDYALISAAQVILEHTRRSDTACRYGGEEFLIILPQITQEDAVRRANELCVNIENLDIEYEEQVIKLTVSVGVAIYPVHGENSDKILSAVDESLYSAKQSGRNQVVVFSPKKRS
ncbi:MAG: diguanylate cyclase [Anaerolineales bacterium]